MSVRSSKLVELFARSWLVMTPAQRRIEPLFAPWNPGGTYDTAFVDLAAAALLASGASPERIFLGKISRIHKGTSGYTLVLSQRHSNGRELWVWIQNATMSSGAVGANLCGRLDAGKIPNGSKVFARGSFMPNHNGGSDWYSLPVVNGSDVWIP